MLLNQRTVVMAALCAIDAGGDISKRIALSLATDAASHLSEQNRGKIFKYLHAATEENKIIEEAQEWSAFVKQCTESEPGEDELIDLPVEVFALALFYAANVGGYAQEIVLSNENIPKLYKRDFIGILDLGFTYNKELISNFLIESDVKINLTMDLISKAAILDSNGIEKILSESKCKAYEILKAGISIGSFEMFGLNFNDDYLNTVTSNLQKSNFIISKAF